MSEEQKKKPKPAPKSTLGERMNDLSGIRVLRNGKWVAATKDVKPSDKPAKDTK
jgi:hypothetical protein